MRAAAMQKPVQHVRRLKVLIVDDSALVRSLLTAIINREPDMEAVGAARDPYIAREMIRTLEPDVITLDIEMPRMDGLDFLEKLMRLRPMPVLMVSTLTEHGAEATLRGLELGAVDFVAKPRVDIRSGIEQSARELVEKIRIAAASHVARIPLHAPSARTAAPVAKPAVNRIGTEKIIVIGASTGGTEAIREVLMQMPPDAPAIAITQHMPAGFTHSFAKRLDGLCRIRVKEAEHGERLLPGYAYIAPGDRHLLVSRSGANYVASLADSQPVNRHRPSVEVLFRSAAANAGANAVAVMLTGMGRDGARAMLDLRNTGAHTIAQDEKTCVVFGMPREAIAIGAVDEVLPIGRIAAAALERVAKTGHRHRV
jgi:two-component system chemotaxis response regulator CheB